MSTLQFGTHESWGKDVTRHLGFDRCIWEEQILEDLCPVILLMCFIVTPVITSEGQKATMLPLSVGPGPPPPRMLGLLRYCHTEAGPLHGTRM